MNHMIDCYGNLAPGEYEDVDNDYLADRLAEIGDDRYDDRCLDDDD